MAEIRSAIELQDRYSPALKNIIRANQMAIAAFRNTENASKNAFDSDGLEEAIKKLARAEVEFDDISESIRVASEREKLFESTISRTEQQIKMADTRQEQFNRTVNAGNVAGGHLLRTITGIASAVGAVSLAKKSMDMSDLQATTEARLGPIVDDGGSIDALQERLMSVANETRTAYFDVAGNAAKLDMLTKEGTFADDAEMLRFSELMNKSFKVSGASSSEATNAMYQLTQAMASGALQGDEFRSIKENAPIIARLIEESMRSAGLEGTIKEWSADGLITAEVIKNAMFLAADEIETKFNELPVTWADNWTVAGNNAIETLNPIFEMINTAASSDPVQNLGAQALTELQEAVAWIEAHSEQIGNVMSKAFRTAGAAIETVGNGIGFIVNNFEKIAPIAGSAAIGIGAYNTAVKLSAVYEGIAAKAIQFKNAATGASAASDMAAAQASRAKIDELIKESLAQGDVARATALKTAATALDTAATGAATTAVQRWTLALNANPFILAATAIMGVVTAVMLFRDQTESATSAIDSISDSYADAVDRASSLSRENMAAAEHARILVEDFKDLAYQESLTTEETDRLYSIYNQLNDQIPNLEKNIPSLNDGFDAQTDSLKDLADQLYDTAGAFYDFAVAQSEIKAYESRFEAATSAKLDLQDERESLLNEIQQVEVDKSGLEERFANDTGSSAWLKQASLEQEYNSIISNNNDQISVIDQNLKDIEDDMRRYSDAIFDSERKISSFGDQFEEPESTTEENDDLLNEIKNEIEEVNGNTNAIKNAVEITEEDLKYLRDIAERDVINRFTTAEISIVQQNTNNISNDLDIDGVVSDMYEGLQETINIAIEGSY